MHYSIHEGIGPGGERQGYCGAPVVSCCKQLIHVAIGYVSPLGSNRRSKHADGLKLRIGITAAIAYRADNVFRWAQFSGQSGMNGDGVVSPVGATCGAESYLLGNGVQHSAAESLQHFQVDLEHNRLRTESVSKVGHEPKYIAHAINQRPSFSRNRLHVQLAEERFTLACIQGARQKRSKHAGDFVQMRFKREMARFGKVYLELWQVAAESFRTLRPAEGVVLAPDRECRRLVRAEVVLELGIVGDVVLVAPIRSSWISLLPGRSRKC